MTQKRQSYLLHIFQQLIILYMQWWLSAALVGIEEQKDRLVCQCGADDALNNKAVQWFLDKKMEVQSHLALNVLPIQMSDEIAMCKKCFFWDVLYRHCVGFSSFLFAKKCIHGNRKPILGPLCSSNRYVCLSVCLSACSISSTMGSIQPNLDCPFPGTRGPAFFTSSQNASSSPSYKYHRFYFLSDHGFDSCFLLSVFF